MEFHKYSSVLPFFLLIRVDPPPPPFYIDTISMDLSILSFNGLQVEISKFQYISALKDVFILANSVDPVEMPLYAVFHLGLHCLTKHLFAGKPCRMKRVLIGPRLFLLGQGRSSQVSISVFRPIQSNRSSPVTVSRHRRVLSRIP